VIGIVPADKKIAGLKPLGDRILIKVCAPAQCLPRRPDPGDTRQREIGKGGGGQVEILVLLQLHGAIHYDGVH
jgi:hypothetical protein